MSRDLESLSVYAEAVVGGRPWERDCKVLPIPWRKEVIQPKGRKLRFGMVGEHDGLVHCHPPVKRALRLARQAVERQGHEVVDWEPRSHDVMTKVCSALKLCCLLEWNADGDRIWQRLSLIWVVEQSWICWSRTKSLFFLL